MTTKKPRIAMISTGNANDAYGIKEDQTDEQIKTYRNFKGYPIEFVRKQETNLYEFYYFRIRRERE